MSASTYKEVSTVIKGVLKPSQQTLWHYRLEHAPMDRIEKIGGLKGIN